jgi:hypothetical protein
MRLSCCRCARAPALPVTPPPGGPLAQPSDAGGNVTVPQGPQARCWSTAARPSGRRQPIESHGSSGTTCYGHARRRRMTASVRPGPWSLVRERVDYGYLRQAHTRLVISASSVATREYSSQVIGSWCAARCDERARQDSGRRCAASLTDFPVGFAALRPASWRTNNVHCVSSAAR